MFFKIRIFREAHFVRAIRHKRMVRESFDIVTVRLVASGNADISIGSVWEKLNGNDASLRPIVRQYFFKIHKIPGQKFLARYTKYISILQNDSRHQHIKPLKKHSKKQILIKNADPGTVWRGDKRQIRMSFTIILEKKMPDQVGHDNSIVKEVG